MNVVPCELGLIRDLDVVGPVAISDREMVIDMLLLVPDADVVLEKYARCLLHDDDKHPLACFGVWPLWHGVASAWSMLSQEVLEDYPKALHREVKRHILEAEAKLELKRLEAIVLYGHTAGHRWMTHLGFRNEGLMRNYGPGGTQDYYRYARTH